MEDIEFIKMAAEYGEVFQRARARRESLRRRRGSEAEEDREWLVYYAALLRERLRREK